MAKLLPLQAALIVASALAQPQWAQLGRDAQHTGQSPYVGPSAPLESWPLWTSGTYSQSSPVIGADGTVYFGASDANDLYALDGVTGASLWAVVADGSGVYSTPSPAATWSSERGTAWYSPSLRRRVTWRGRRT